MDAVVGIGEDEVSEAGAPGARRGERRLRRRLEGGTVRGKEYPPVIRAEPRDTRSVTWAEFVEAGMLRQYRRELIDEIPRTATGKFKKTALRAQFLETKVIRCQYGNGSTNPPDRRGPGARLNCRC